MDLVEKAVTLYYDTIALEDAIEENEQELDNTLNRMDSSEFSLYVEITEDL